MSGFYTVLRDMRDFMQLNNDICVAKKMESVLHKADIQFAAINRVKSTKRVNKSRGFKSRHC